MGTPVTIRRHGEGARCVSGHPPPSPAPDWLAWLVGIATAPLFLLVGKVGKSFMDVLTAGGQVRVDQAQQQAAAAQQRAAEAQEQAALEQARQAGVGTLGELVVTLRGMVTDLQNQVRQLTEDLGHERRTSERFRGRVLRFLGDLFAVLPSVDDEARKRIQRLVDDFRADDSWKAG